MHWPGQVFQVNEILKGEKYVLKQNSLVNKIKQPIRTLLCGDEEEGGAKHPDHVLRVASGSRPQYTVKKKVTSND